MRIEDLDTQRCKPEFARQAIEDLKWLGLDWDGEMAFQSNHSTRYLDAWRKLKEAGFIYPCKKSRKEIRARRPPQDPDEQDVEAIFPMEWRPEPGAEKGFDSPEGVTWRFRVPDGQEIEFTDVHNGKCVYIAGEDFGDFSIWRRDGVPAYELSVVVDDIHQGITEVVRGRDLLRSTARQLLLYQALGAPPPAWCHEPLVRDPQGVRLAKRFHSLSIRELREKGISPDELPQLAEKNMTEI